MISTTRLAAILAILLLPTTLFAHQEGEFAERMIERMQEKLDLTEPQAEAVADVFASVRAACGGAEFGPEKRECLREQKSTVKEQMAEILSEDQLSELREMRDQARERRCKTDKPRRRR